MNSTPHLDSSRLITLLVRSFSVMAVVFCTTLAGANEWILTYAVTAISETDTPDNQSPAKKESRAYTRTIALGQQHLGVDDGHGKRVYDFARRRMIYLHPDKQEYSDWSLYAGIAARIHELENRFGLGAGFRAMKIAGKNLFGRYDNEANLGLELPGMKFNEPDPVIKRIDLPGGGWGFQHEGLSVVQFIPSEKKVPAAFYARFSNFLAYECNLHPKIRRQIAATGKIPERLVIRWQLGGKSNAATYRLQSVDLAESDGTKPPEGFNVASPQGESSAALFHVISLTQNKDRARQQNSREQIGRFAQEAIAQHRPLDAYLALLEYRIQSGEKHPDDFQPYRRDFDQDERCRLYMISQDQSSAEACRKGLAACDSIDRTGLQKAYMLDLQRADLLQILGRDKTRQTGPSQQNQTLAAEKLFLSVLEINPFLAGAYHDLGRLYDETFRSPEAWLCFDTARRISPDHFMLKGITNLELRFEHDFPDHF